MNRPVFLISHRGALGDFILTWPVLIALRKHYKNHQFIGFGRPEYLEFAKYFNLLDEVYNCESKDLLAFYSGQSIPAFIQPLEHTVCWMKKDKKFEAMLSRNEIKSFYLAPPIPEDNKHHIIDFHLNILSRFGLPRMAEPKLYLPISSEPKQQTYIHPGSGSANKNFEPEFYLFVANELVNQKFPGIKFIIGPNEHSFKEIYSKQFPIFEPESILDLAIGLAGSHFYLGNDSGISHLSALLGVRTVALFKITDPAIWGVRGIRSDNIDAQNEAQAMAKIQKLLRKPSV